MKINSLLKEYHVEFSQDLSLAKNAWSEVSEKVFCVDRKVFEIIGHELEDGPVYILDANEDEKTLHGIERLLLWMQAQSLHRGTTVIAIGGGITQDITAFAAHTYFRGLTWWFLPTTLLAQADSCIGSKYGVNLGGRKNQVGNYNPPDRVFICADFLKTLPARDLMSGYGEIFRLMWTASKEDFKKFAAAWKPGVGLGDRLPETIRRGLEIKRGVIEKDEFEKDLRRILNYGHTFGHALEVLTNHQIPHGLAVVWGMDLIDSISCQMGMLDPETKAEKREVSKKIFGPVFQEIPGIQNLFANLKAEDLLSVIRLDKKSSSGKIKLVLNAGASDLRVVPIAIDIALLDFIQKALHEL